MPQDGTLIVVMLLAVPIAGPPTTWLREFDGIGYASVVPMQRAKINHRAIGPAERVVELISGHIAHADL